MTCVTEALSCSSSRWATILASEFGLGHATKARHDRPKSQRSVLFHLLRPCWQLLIWARECFAWQSPHQYCSGKFRGRPLPAMDLASPLPS